MKDYSEMAWLMERIMHKYAQYEKMPQKYCEDVILTQPEIHTVAIIGDKEGIGVTELAKIRGITKGAVSQMVDKLVEKGLVEKRENPHSKAAISLYLTRTGIRARAEHRKLHETMGTRFAVILEKIPEETRESMMCFLEAFEEELDR